jgi:hypothetical protein
MTLVNERSENHRPGNIEQPTKHQIHDHTPQESVPRILMNVIFPATRAGIHHTPYYYL